MEIEHFEQELIETSDRVERAGWDGVEVAAHMSYFAASFLSPRTNKRTDHYAGPVEVRARMLVNIVSGIRARTRPDFIVGLRITSNDYMPDEGPTAFAAIAMEVERAGLDYVALSPGGYETMDLAMPARDGGMVESGEARIFKDMLSVPVMAQALHDPFLAARAIRDGKADFCNACAADVGGTGLS